MKFSCAHGCCVIRPARINDNQYGIAFSKPDGTPCCTIPTQVPLRSNIDARVHIQELLGNGIAVDYKDLPGYPTFSPEFLEPFVLESKTGETLNGFYMPLSHFSWTHTSQGLVCSTDDGPLGTWNGEAWLRS